MVWAYFMVILTDPGKVSPELQAAPTVQPIHAPQPQSQQQPGQEGADQSQLSHQSTTSNTLEPHILQVQQARQDHSKAGSATSLGSTGVLIPGAQSNRSGTIYISEDPSAQGHPLWCSKCQHVKPERAHHCRVCKRCVLKMDHHCPWVLNCVGQDNYKFFFLFVFYTAVHCVYILVSLAPLYLRFPAEASFGVVWISSWRPYYSWAHQMQIVGMVISGVFGITLVVFTITHLRLILLNRTTIEDHDTPREEGMLPCIRKKWVDGEGEINQGNERLYDVGFNQNWEQAMGKGWTCMIPVRFLRPEGPIYNQKVVARQWKDYNQQLEEQRQQQQQQLQQLQQVAIQQQQPQQPGQQPLQDQDQSIPAVVTARENSIDSEVHHRSNSIPQVQDHVGPRRSFEV
ncbi:hypothetical protein BGZ67_010636 [Mortierella alpina]|nr:hypothetical protein BGZ67_010636 [Mortierella alpina]